MHHHQLLAEDIHHFTEKRLNVHQLACCISYALVLCLSTRVGNNSTNLSNKILKLLMCWKQIVNWWYWWQTIELIMLMLKLQIKPSQMWIELKTQPSLIGRLHEKLNIFIYFDRIRILEILKLSRRDDFIDS